MAFEDGFGKIEVTFLIGGEVSEILPHLFLP